MRLTIKSAGKQERVVYSAYGPHTARHCAWSTLNSHTQLPGFSGAFQIQQPPRMPAAAVSAIASFFVAAHPAQSHQQRLTQRIFPPAPRRKTCARGRCLFRRRHWAASSQSTNRRLDEGRVLIWRRWRRGVRGERGATPQMDYS